MTLEEEISAGIEKLHQLKQAYNNPETAPSDDVEDLKMRVEYAETLADTWRKMFEQTRELADLRAKYIAKLEKYDADADLRKRLEQ